MKESVVKSMRIKVEGKNEVLNNLEKAERLIDQHIIGSIVPRRQERF